MKKLIGFIAFWIAVGMLLMLFLSHHYLIALIIIGLLLLLGYNFFIVIDVRCKDQICITALCSLLQRNGEGYGGAGVRSKAGFGRTG